MERDTENLSPLERSVDELLTCGADDWVDAAEVAWVARSVGGATTEAEIRELSIDLIREVLEQGFMRIGDVTKEGFRPWPLSSGDAVLRVRNEWTALGRGPRLGEIFWLENTETGDQRSRRVRNSS